jgi:hypothetical protein
MCSYVVCMISTYQTLSIEQMLQLSVRCKRTNRLSCQIRSFCWWISPCINYISYYHYIFLFFLRFAGCVLYVYIGFFIFLYFTDLIANSPSCVRFFYLYRCCICQKKLFPTALFGGNNCHNLDADCIHYYSNGAFLRFDGIFRGRNYNGLDVLMITHATNDTNDDGRCDFTNK